MGGHARTFIKTISFVRLFKKVRGVAYVITSLYNNSIGCHIECNHNVIEEVL